MLDRTRSDHDAVIAQTQAALLRGRADLARLKAVVEQSLFQVNASRIALNVSRETLRSGTVGPFGAPRAR